MKRSSGAFFWNATGSTNKPSGSFPWGATNGYGRISLAALIDRLKTYGAVACYLPSTYATSAWQRYDATTSRAALSYGVGFLGDMLQGMALGAELIVNGDFSAGLTGWFGYRSTLSIASGKVMVTNTTTNTGACVIASPITVAINDFFQVKADLFSGSGVALQEINFGGIDRTYTSDFVICRALGTALQYMVTTKNGVIGDYAQFDNASIKLITGRHSTQETHALRPTLLFNGSVYYLSHTSGQKLTAYVPSSLGATCTIVYASPGVGAIKLENIPVLSNAVDLSWNHSGLVILPSSATADQIARATAIMNQLAWGTVV